MTKLRKDETVPPGKPGIDFLLPEERESLQKEQPGSSADTGKTTPKPVVPHPAAENMFVEDLTSIPEQAHWNCVRKGKIHVLEIFAGSARFSQCCALSGLKVGTPVDIRTGFDVMTSKKRHMVMEIIREQAPDVILMAHGLWTMVKYAEHPTRPTKGWGKAETWHPLRDIS